MAENDKSLELFLGAIDVPPEEADNDTEALESHEERAEYLYAAEDIINNIGESDFKEIYKVSIDVLRKQSFRRQQKTVEQIIDKIETIYDFRFPEKVELNTIYQLNRFYEFIEFLEYDSSVFLSYVWRFIKKNIVKINIKEYCEINKDKIIKEVEEQLESHPQNEIITIFLRTYYKDKFIDWFSRGSEKFKVNISIENFESED